MNAGNTNSAIFANGKESRKKENEIFPEVETLTKLCLEILERFEKGKIRKEEVNYKCILSFQELNTFLSLKEEEWGKKIWRDFKVWKVVSFLINIQKIKSKAKDLPEVRKKAEELESYVNSRTVKESLTEKPFFVKLGEVVRSFFS